MNHAKPFGALVVLAIMALGILGSLPAAAQPQTGDLLGGVVDNQGESLPGVNVTLTGSGPAQEQVTNAEGQFRFLNLDPGSYRVQAQLAGFSTVSYPNIRITAGKNTNLQITMNPQIEN